MEQKKINKIVKNRIREIEKMLIKKGNEYANTDRLSNFKDGAALLHCTPERVLLGYVAKHMVALSEFVNRIEVGGEVKPEQWLEKFQDIAIYMLLLEPVLIESGRMENGSS